MTTATAALLTLAGCLAAAVTLVLVRAAARRRDDLGTVAQRSTFDALHTASLVAPALRGGLTAEAAQAAIGHVRALLGAPAVALTDRDVTLAVDAAGHHHAQHAAAAVTDARAVLDGGPTQVVVGAAPARSGACGTPDCSVRAAVAVALTDGDVVVGALVAYARGTTAILVRAVEEVAAWVSAQLELSSAEAQRRLRAEAELRALRAQISPHFVYNSLTAIASFTRTDPDRARELLLEFADFSRYALRRGNQFATLADELRNTERYLVLEQARFGDRLRVTLRVAPETLPIAVPFLVVQPLVENAVRHGLESDSDVVTVTIEVADAGPVAVLTVEDDGVGADPDAVRAALLGADADGARAGGSVGLANVDSRLRQVFGDRYGLVVETAPGAGTRVEVRIPKYAPGVRADG